MNELERKKLLALRMQYGFGITKQESETDIPSGFTLTDDEIQSGRSIAEILEERKKRLEAAQEKRRRERFLHGG